jgi:hypothetical protein
VNGKIFTSTWLSRELGNLACVPVGISRSVPKWPLPYSYRMLRMLAPTREMFHLDEPPLFETLYRTQLDGLGVERIASALTSMSEKHGGKPLVLLCWEKPGEPCHRRIFSKWFEEETGIVVPELSPGMIDETFTTQERLF